MTTDSGDALRAALRREIVAWREMAAYDRNLLPSQRVSASAALETCAEDIERALLSHPAEEAPEPEMAAFDRGEFDELLKEVVALREWKAAHEAAAFRAGEERPSGPSEGSNCEVTQ